MQVVFWGARGSISVSGPQFRDFGGNTTCVEVRSGDCRLVLDGGTGIRALGSEIGFAPSDVTILFTHVHWDHIQGIPFFTPAFNPNNEIRVISMRREGPGIKDVLASQMTSPTFPISLDFLRGLKTFEDIELNSSFRVGPFTVTSVDLSHPDGVVAYHIEAEGKRVVFATDVEHGGETLDSRLVEISRGVDLLIHDAQYTMDEYMGRTGPSRQGWGHSSWEEAVELAERADVRSLGLFHHDPARSDEGIRAIEAQAQAHFAQSFAVREFQRIDL